MKTTKAKLVYLLAGLTAMMILLSCKVAINFFPSVFVYLTIPSHPPSLPLRIPPRYTPSYSPPLTRYTFIIPPSLPQGTAPQTAKAIPVTNG